MGQGAGRPEQQHAPMIVGSNGSDNSNANNISSSDDDIEAARARIEQTRAEMSETIEAIKSKLDPQVLVEHAKETVREATVGRAEEAVGQAVGTARDVADQVKETAKSALGSAKQTVGGALFSARDALDTTLNSARESTSGLLDSARNVVSNTGERAKDAGAAVADTVRGNPIPVAATGVGLVLLLVAATAARRRPSPADPSDVTSTDVTTIDLTLPPDLAAPLPVEASMTSSLDSSLEVSSISVGTAGNEVIEMASNDQHLQDTPQADDFAAPAATPQLVDSLVIGGALAVLLGGVTYGLIRRAVAP